MACDGACQMIAVVMSGVGVIVVGWDESAAWPAKKANEAESKEDATTAENVMPMLVVDDDSHSFAVSSASPDPAKGFSSSFSSNLSVVTSCIVDDSLWIPSS